MTEADWLECIQPEQMLVFLGDRASLRQARLLACACVRRLWPLLDERLRLAVKVAERYADGRLTEANLQQAQRLVKKRREQWEEEERKRPNWTTLAERAAAQAVEALLPTEGPILFAPRDVRDPPDVISASRVARAAARAFEARREEGGASPSGPSDTFRRLEALDAVELIRDIFGNPFRPFAFDPHWLAWREKTLPRLASTIYQKRCFRNMPLLADALEEAGCRDADILSHCRAHVDHARGCWVVDAMLGLASGGASE